MSKAIMGAAELGGAAVLGGLMLFPGTAEFFNNPVFYKMLETLALSGIAMEAGAIAGELTSNRGMNITTRQTAAFQQIIYGTQRVGGVEIFLSTTGSHHNQYNFVVILAGHVCDSIVNMYLDGRQVHFIQGSVGNTTQNGINFGGSSDSNSYPGPNGVQYNFGGKVYAEAKYGDQLPGDVIGGLTANDPMWAASSAGSPYVGGCTYLYVKIEYDTNIFPGQPEMRFTVNGKPVYDPRTNTTAFSTNWALICNDILIDPVFGLGDDRVNQAQLIAAANVCDEQVALASGGTEAQYTTSHHYDTSSAPGDVLTTMMSGANGRLVDSGGEYFLFPDYYIPPTFSFHEGNLTGTITYEEKGRAELFNRVNGTYTAPNLPYNVAGNLYDSNGFYAGQIQDNFTFAFQSTSYPAFAADSRHGFASDQFLTEDGGVLLEKELPLPTVLSVAQCQRVASLNLFRNRLQKGSGTFPMNLDAYRLIPTDVIQFSFAAMGWTNKLLEVTGVNLKFVDSGEGMQSLQTEVQVQDYDPTIFSWNAVLEELPADNILSTPTQTPYTPAPPTEITLISSAATELTGADGIVRPRIEVTWASPLDILTKQIQVQFQLSTASALAWLDAGSVDVSLNQTYIAGVVSGLNYNVRIRSVRANGAFSEWLEETNYTVSASTTSIGTVYLNPNSPFNVDNTAVVDSIVENASATIRVNGVGGDPSSFQYLVGAATFSIPGAHITGLAFGTAYYVIFAINYYNVETLTIGGFLTTTQNPNDTLLDTNLLICAITTCLATYTGSGGTGTGGGGGTTLPGNPRGNLPDQQSTE